MRSGHSKSPTLEWVVSPWALARVPIVRLAIVRASTPPNKNKPRPSRSLCNAGHSDVLKRARRDSNPQPPDRQSHKNRVFRLKNAVARHTDTSLRAQKQGRPVSRHRFYILGRLLHERHTAF